MNNKEICDIARSIVGQITAGLNSGIYRSLGGELAVGWGTDSIYGAYASSRGSISDPPLHTITIYEAFAIQMWRDAENFCHFMDSIPKDSDTDKLYDFYGDRTKLPECFSREEHIRNIFTAAITWVYFHELGHLIQEHGYVRGLYGLKGYENHKVINDLEAAGEDVLEGNDAVVSHVTELAADFEATTIYVSELMRHIVETEFVEVERRTEVLAAILSLMISGVAIVFYRFGGSKPEAPVAVPRGSHPMPLIRLERLLPQVFEFLDIQGVREISGHNLSRRDLVLLSAKAGFSAALFWSMTKTPEKQFDSDFVMKGILTNPVVLEYLQPIVTCWDDMRPKIEKVRRFGVKMGLMDFTDEFRERIQNLTIWGTGRHANEVDGIVKP